MTSEDMNRTIEELKRHFPAATLYLEYPGYIDLSFENLEAGGSRRHYLIGDINPQWTIDFYRTSEDMEHGDPAGGFSALLQSAYTDPWLVALNVAAAISRHEIDL